MSTNEHCYSVLMAVYAKEQAQYLEQSFQSMVCQTLLPTEVVLVEDGPLGDDLHAVIQKFGARLNIVTVKLQHNVGLAAALNEGLKHCSYELVARMDSDDICFDNRFEQQVAFMNSAPDIAMSSGYIEEYDDKMQNILSVRTLPLHHEELLVFSRTRSPMSHAATIYRKTAVLKVGGYPVIYPEDYALWSLMIADGCKMANLPTYLLKVRAGDAMISRRGAKFLKGYIQTYALMHRLGLISYPQFLMNVFKQAVVRLSPAFIRKLLYKHARS